ncbi:MAG TPA: porin [Bacteroidota bacterium]|nr:porin [Bacteroidota bacterium]
MNKKRTMWGGLALLLLVSAGPLLAGGFQLNEAGARAMAQADAFAARANDASAIFFNPAGLAFQPGHSLLLGTTFIAPSVTFYGPIRDANDPGISTVSKLKNAVFTPINLYAKFQITNDLHAGIGVNNPFGLGTEWDANWVGRFITQKVDLKTFYVTPTLAYRVTDRLSVGAGFNYVFGSVLIKRAVSITSVAVPESPVVTLDLTAKNGYGWNVGVKYKVSDDISVGASYRSQVKIDAKGTAAFAPNYPPLGLPIGDASASLKLPATGFAGISYKAMKNLEIEADYQFIGWSSYDTLAIDFAANPAARSAQPKLYNDTYILRLGGEYTMNNLRLRAGYYFDHSPVPTKYLEPLLPDSDRQGFNIGAGYQLTNNLHIDLSYMFLKGAQRKAEQTDTKFDGTYNSYVNLLGVNLGYNF